MYRVIKAQVYQAFSPLSLGILPLSFLRGFFPRPLPLFYPTLSLISPLSCSDTTTFSSQSFILVPLSCKHWLQVWKPYIYSFKIHILKQAPVQVSAIFVSGPILFRETLTDTKNHWFLFQIIRKIKSLPCWVLGLWDLWSPCLLNGL